MWRIVMIQHESGSRRLSDREYTTAAGAAAAGARWAEGGPDRSFGVQEGTEPPDLIMIGKYIVTCGADGQPAHCTCSGYMYAKPHMCRHLVEATSQAA